MAKKMEESMNRTNESNFSTSQYKKTSRNKDINTLNDKGEYVDFEEIKE